MNYDGDPTRSYPSGARGLARLCWPPMEVAVRMVFHLRGDRTMSGFVVNIDGHQGLPTLVELDGGRMVPWLSIDWFEVEE